MPSVQRDAQRPAVRRRETKDRAAYEVKISQYKAAVAREHGSVKKVVRAAGFKAISAAPRFGCR
jgi:hypothetical protein